MQKQQKPLYVRIRERIHHLYGNHPIYLVSGSRAADEALVKVATNALEIIKPRVLICGEAPGIDTAVIAWANENEVPCVVFGIGKSSRVKLAEGAPYMQVEGGKYAARDEFMVNVAGKVLCVWDGKSKGTRHVFDYAMSLNKPARLLKA